MPRVTATARPGISRPASRTRAKKIAPQDRLSARTLFLRRVRRSLRPGLWLLAVVSLLIVGTAFFRNLHLPAATNAAATTHHGFGLASLAADAGFRIENVEVVGARTTDPAALAAAIGVRAGEPSLGISLSDIRARVAALGPVQTATVERVLPGTLIVRVTERGAYAIWQTGGNGAPLTFQLIDKAGNVIADQDAAAAKRREPGLLLLVGANAPANAQTLLEALAAQPAVQARTAAAERIDGLRWNLILKNQTVVKLPIENMDGALAELSTLQRSMSLLDRPVEVIDLRIPGRLVVRPYPASVDAPAASPGEHT
jgi:cell division protein FtsQ